MKTDGERLLEYAISAGLTLEEAADDVLLHYDAFDYKGTDKDFIIFCEKLSRGIL